MASSAQAGTIWFWVETAAAGGDELHAAVYISGSWYIAQIDGDDELVIPVLVEQNEWLSISAAAEPIETFAAQPHYGDNFETYIPEELADYRQFAEQLEPFAPPEVLVPELIAAQGEFQAWAWPDPELEDYQPEVDALPAFLNPPVITVPDEVFAAQPEPQAWVWGADEPEDYNALGVHEQIEPFAPPEAVVPELLAAQGHPDHDFDTLVPPETQDYAAPPEQLEPFAPPEIVVPELAAATELREQPWYPDQETEDYSQDPNLEVPALYQAVPPAPDEVVASQPHFGEWLWEAQETEEYSAFAEQNEPFAPPEAGIVELEAAQFEAADDYFFVPEETQDYANDTALDVSAFLAGPSGPTDAELAATQLLEQFWFEDVQTEDYAAPEVSVEWFLGTIPDAELAVTSQILEQPWFDAEEQDTWSNDAPLDITAQSIIDHLFAAIVLPEHWHYESETWIDPSPDDSWLNLLLTPITGGVKGPTRKTVLTQGNTATEQQGPNRASAGAGNIATESAGPVRATRVGTGTNSLEDM